MSAKTTYQRSAKGNIAVSDVHPEAQFVAIENTSRKVGIKDQDYSKDI